MASKYSHSRWDIIVSSSEIKKLIISRAEILKVRMFNLAEAEKCDWTAFKNDWLNNPSPVVTKHVHPRLISNIASRLGIKLRVTAYIEEGTEHLNLEQYNVPYKRIGRPRKNG